MGRVVLDEWHIRLEIDDRVADAAAAAVIERFAELIAGAARSIELDFRARGGINVAVTFDR